MDDVSEEKEECSLWPVSVGVRSGLVLKEAKEAAMVSDLVILSVSNCLYQIVCVVEFECLFHRMIVLSV